MILLSQPLLITIIVLSIIFGVYLLIVLVNLLFIATFRHTMKKHNKALSVLYTSKLDQLIKMHQMLIDNGASFDQKVTTTIKQLSPENFADQNLEECKIAKDKLTYLQQEIMVKLPLFPALNESTEFTLINDLLVEIERNMRIYSIAYNSDVLGYNYWVRFMPCRYIFLIFRIKLKETI